MLRRVPFARGIPSLVTGISLKSSNTDALDLFTTELLRKLEDDRKLQLESTPKGMEVDEEKVTLMRKLKTHRSDRSLPFEHSMDIRELSAGEVDGYVTVTIDADDRRTFNGIAEQFHQFRMLPRNDLVVRSLQYMCDDTNDAMAPTIRLIDVCREKNLHFYATDMKFAPFLAQYLWRADQFDAALSVLRQTYATDNAAIKGIVLQNFQCLLRDAIANREEGALEKIETFATEIFQRRHDLRLMQYVFNDCFLSTWFRDRTIAVQLFRLWEPLRTSFCMNADRFVYERLQQHDVDAVQRLIELCLQFKLTNECRVCLFMLFDYQCKCRLKADVQHRHGVDDFFPSITDWLGDLRACTETLNLCLKLQIPLSDAQSQKLINLLLNPKKEESLAPKRKEIPFIPFKLKF